MLRDTTRVGEDLTWGVRYIGRNIQQSLICDQGSNIHSKNLILKKLTKMVSLVSFIC